LICNSVFMVVRRRPKYSLFFFRTGFALTSYAIFLSFIRIEFRKQFYLFANIASFLFHNKQYTILDL
jgi:hypothetical protein